MKKLILSAFILSTATLAAHAQSNSILLYGNAGYHSTKYYNDDKARSYNFNIGLGYQFDNHWTAGVFGSFGSDRALVSGNNILPVNKFWNFQNYYEAGAFLRHTIGLGKIFAIFNQLNVGYLGNTYGSTDAAINGPNVSANGFHANLTPYIGVNVYRGFALNFSFGGLDYKTQSSHGASSNSFDITFGSQLNVGVSKNFACGKRHYHGMKKNHGEVEEKILKEEE